MAQTFLKWFQNLYTRAPLARVTGDLKLNGTRKSEVTHSLTCLYRAIIRDRDPTPSSFSVPPFQRGRLEMDIVHELARGVPAHEVLVRHPLTPARLRLAWADFRLACVPLGLRAFRVLHLQQRVRLCLVR